MNNRTKNFFINCMDSIRFHDPDAEALETLWRKWYNLPQDELWAAQDILSIPCL